MIARNNLPTLKHSAIIILCSVVIMLPAFMFGAGGGDLHCQSLWAKFFSMQFWQGDLYPRWLMDMYVGDGSPIFFYYPPLANFVAAFFTFLSSLDPFGFYPIAASALVSVIVSGIALYVWAREEGCDSNAALIGSLLYLTAPFHIAQNFYYTLLLGFVWSYAWIPFLLLFAKKIAQNKPYAMTGFAVALCLLVLSNMPMTLIFGPIAVAYAIVNFQKPEFFKQLIKLGFAVLLGFGLASIYLLPALLYMNYANVDMHWKLPGQKGGYSANLLHIGFDSMGQSLFSLLWLSCVAFPFFYFKDAKQKLANIFLFIALGISLFMMLPISQFIWESLPIFKILENPLRFFAVPSVLLAFFAALNFPRFKEFSYGLIAAYIMIACVIAWNTRTSVESFSKTEPERYEQYRLAIDQYSSYLTTPNLINRYYMPEGLEEVKKHREKVEVLNGNAQIEVTAWQPRNIVFHYDAKVDSEVRVRQLDFPGFRAFTADKELDVKRDDVTGEMLVDIAEGEGDINLKLTKLLPEIAGKMLSILCLAGVILLCLLEMREKKK